LQGVEADDWQLFRARNAVPVRSPDSTERHWVGAVDDGGRRRGEFE